MSTLLKMQKFHPLCSRCIGMYPLQNRWTVLRYLQCYENFSECCTHLILPETALFSPTPTFAKEPYSFSTSSKHLEFPKFFYGFRFLRLMSNDHAARICSYSSKYECQCSKTLPKSQKHFFHVYTPFYLPTIQYHKIRVLHPILLNLIYVNVEI